VAIAKNRSIPLHLNVLQGILKENIDNLIVIRLIPRPSGRFFIRGCIKTHFFTTVARRRRKKALNINSLRHSDPGVKRKKELLIQPLFSFGSPNLLKLQPGDFCFADIKCSLYDPSA